MVDFAYHCQQQTAIIAGKNSWRLYSGYGFLPVLPAIPLESRYADFKARLAQKIRDRINV